MIRLGIIGGSFDSTISKSHLRAILATNKYKIISGCFSRNKKKNTKNSNFYNVPLERTYNDFKSFLKIEKKHIDLCVILTPPNNRINIYKELIRYNLPFVTEKPFEANLANTVAARNLLKKNKKLFVGSTYNYLNYPAIMEIPNVLKKIGKINYFNFMMPQQSATFYNNIMKGWRKKDIDIPNLHLDLSSHLLSFILYFFKELPKSVNSSNQISISEGFVVNNNTKLKFMNFNGNLWFSKNATGNRNNIKLEIYGDKGSIHWEHENHEILKYFDNKGNITILNRLNKNLKFMSDASLYTYSAGHPFGFLETFINNYNLIYDAFKKNKKIKNLLTIKENLNIASILDAMVISSKKEKWVNIKYIK